MTTDPGPRPPLDKARLAAGADLGADLSVELLDETPSTNAVAVERAQAGAPEGLVVVADHQTQGRGRLDRVWESPALTAVTFSLLLRPTMPAGSWPWLPLLTGYAVDRALDARGLDAGVKWPNDVLIGGRKVAGILVERVDTTDGPAAVVGVGINVSMTGDELPVPEATSLSLESAAAPDRTDVLVEVLTSIREAYDAWQAGGDLDGANIEAAYAEACVTVGQDVRVDLPDGVVLEGRATGIDPAGRLVVATERGERQVGAGDVVHVRRIG